MFSSITVLAAEEPSIAGGDLVTLFLTTFALITVLVVAVVAARRKIKSSTPTKVILTPLPLPRTRTGDEDENDLRIATIRPVVTAPQQDSTLAVSDAAVLDAAMLDAAVLEDQRDNN